MKTVRSAAARTLLVSMAALSLMVFCAPSALARAGSGRSFGARGSRSVAPRSYGGSPTYDSSRAAPAAPSSPYSSPVGGYGSYGGYGYNGGGFWGGMTGGFLGSLLFGPRYGYGYGYGYGYHGFGTLDLLVLLVVLGFFAFRYFLVRTATGEGRAAGTLPGWMGQGGGSSYNDDPRAKLRSVAPGPYAAAPVAAAAGQEQGGETAVAAEISRYDRGFDLRRFKDARTHEFLLIEKAWSARELTAVDALLAPAFRAELDAELSRLRTDGVLNRLEPQGVPAAELVEAWQELGQEYATVQFSASLLDYTVNERTSEVAGGSPTVPVQFVEYWTFVRAVASPESPWRLTAIEQSK